MAKLRVVPAPPARRPPRGRALVRDGFLTEEQYEQVVARQALTGQSFLRVALELGYITDDQLTRITARYLGLELVEDLDSRPLDLEAAAAIPLPTARRYGVVPLAIDEDGRLVLAVSDPTNVIALDDLRTITRREIRIVLATRADIREAHRRLAESDRSAQQLLEAAAREEEDEEAGPEIAAEEAPIVKAINDIITKAFQARASDIHIEPQERAVRIRYRIDGVLHERGTAPKKLQSGMISRIKVMADLDIAEKRVPQDGRITIKVDGRPLDLRVATLPSVWGEKVVMRILDRSAALLRLEDLGFLEDALARYRQSFTKPYGAILVTGPTGSGKSTTLYATLNILNTPDKNIITVEDPVEYRIQGINQVQVHPKAGLTFASALRSILRADPDIVMIGEIRDRETATIAVEAALTGHLVLSTLHTNDAPSAVTRLTEMGVEPFLVASALDCVMAQRLARRLCERCKEPYTPTPEALVENRFPWQPGEPLPTLYRPVGCASCAGTGYRGRLALVEVMLVSEEIERLCVERRSSEEIKQVAISQGMRTLREDGMEKARRGLTSVEEVLRVVV